MIVDPEPTLNTESYPGAGVLGVRSDVRENGEDKLVWECNNYKMEQVNIQSEELTQELVLRLV